MWFTLFAVTVVVAVALSINAIVSDIKDGNFR